MQRRVIFILPVLLAVVASAARAGTADAQRDALLQQHRERLAQKREQQFRAADRDGNGGLSRTELAASSLPKVLTSRFDEIDSDHSGELSPQELQALERRQLGAVTKRNSSQSAVAPETGNP